VNKFNTKFGFSVITLAFMLIGMVALPVSAAYVPLIEETTTQDLLVSENGHTYLYKDDSFEWPGMSYLVHEDDLDYRGFTYQSSGWISSVVLAPLRAPATRAWPMYNFMGTINQGWLGNSSILPAFHDFINTTTDPSSLSFENKRLVFPVDDGGFTSLMMQPGRLHYGTFNLTNEEFIHLTIAGYQDTTTIWGAVIDPQGNVLTDFSLLGGNIHVAPFRPSGPGMYILYLSVSSWTDNLCTVDFKMDSVTPEVIPFGGYAEGVLPGSEYFSDDNDGSLIFEEKAPSAFTYKFTANSTYPGRIRQFMNLPELDNDVYNWYSPWIHITSDVFIEGPILSRYENSLLYNSEPFYYQSFQNESYYCTVIGMENVEYSLYHDLPVVDELPINQEFYLENTDVNMETVAYSLHLAQDSVLRINSTIGLYGYGWNLETVMDNMLYRHLDIIDDSDFGDAEIYYLPAGEYLITAQASDVDSSGFFEFNLGPVVDGVGSVAVDNGHLIGVRFDTSALDWYNVSVSFNTHDNITVGTDIEFFNAYGGSVIDLDGDWGNQQTGFNWEEYPMNYSSWILTEFTDGFGIAVISPYMVENNTAGLVGDEYHEYSLDYTVNVTDGHPWFFNDTATMAVTDTAASHNFTLGDPADTYEQYLVTLDAPEGIWLNVSIHVEDVLDWDCTIFQTTGQWTQTTDWDYLDDTFSGLYDNQSAFQFGSFGDRITMVFFIERNGSDVGRFDIVIDPMLTNTYEDMPPLMYLGNVAQSGGFELAPDMGLVLGGLGVAVVVVVIVVVVLKKRATAT